MIANLYCNGRFFRYLYNIYSLIIKLFFSYSIYIAMLLGLFIFYEVSVSKQLDMDTSVSIPALSIVNLQKKLKNRRVRHPGIYKKIYNSQLV